MYHCVCNTVNLHTFNPMQVHLVSINSTIFVSINLFHLELSLKRILSYDCIESAQTNLNYQIIEIDSKLFCNNSKVKNTEKVVSITKDI